MHHSFFSAVFTTVILTRSSTYSHTRLIPQNSWQPHQPLRSNGLAHVRHISIARGDDFGEDCSQMKIAGNAATPWVCCLCKDRATSLPKLKKTNRILNLCQNVLAITQNKLQAYKNTTVFFKGNENQICRAQKEVDCDALWAINNQMKLHAENATETAENTGFISNHNEYPQKSNVLTF